LILKDYQIFDLQRGKYPKRICNVLVILNYFKNMEVNLNQTTLEKVIHFIFRFLFSTNHKRGALVSLNQEAILLYGRIVTVKPFSTYQTYRMEVKRLSVVNANISLRKRTPIMISSICEAGNKIGNLVIKHRYHSNNLLCGANELSLVTGNMVGHRYSVGTSQGLGETNFCRGLLRYGYKGGLYSGHPGKYEKPARLLVKEYSTTPTLLNDKGSPAKQGFFDEFMQLKKHQGKYLRLTSRFDCSSKKTTFIVSNISGFKWKSQFKTNLKELYLVVEKIDLHRFSLRRRLFH